MEYQFEENNFCVNVSLRQTFSIILSTIQRGTFSWGNFRQLRALRDIRPLFYRKFVASAIREGSYNRFERGKHIPLRLSFWKSNNSRGAARAKLLDDKSIFVLWNAASSIHPRCFSCFPIRRASTSLFAKSFSPRNWRNLRAALGEKDDSCLFFFLLTPTFRCLLPVERTVRFRGLFTFNNSTRNRIPILNIQRTLSSSPSR